MGVMVWLPVSGRLADGHSTLKSGSDEQREMFFLLWMAFDFSRGGSGGVKLGIILPSSH